MEYLSQKGMSQVFADWASADPNINQFGYGQFFNENGEPKVKQVYPGAWVNPQSTEPLSDYAFTRRYQVLIYDLVFLDNLGNSNQNDVVSDCEELAFRLVRYLKETAGEIIDLRSWSLQPLSDRWLDKVSGVILDLTVEFNFQFSNCDDPTYGFPIKYNEV
jgi:hypothetical protein